MYCSVSDIVSVVNQSKIKHILGLEGDGNIPEEALEKFIVAASSEIDLELGSLYVVPITAAQPLAMLVPICRDLAIVAIWEYNSDGELPKWVQRRKDKAEQRLSSFTTESQTGFKLLPEATRNTGVEVVSPEAMSFPGESSTDEED